MKKEPESKTGTMPIEKITEAVKAIYKDAYDISINFYNIDLFDLIFNIDLYDEFQTTELYRYDEKQFKELIVKYLEKKNIKVKMSKTDDYNSAHIYFDKSILKFRYL